MLVCMGVGKNFSIATSGFFQIFSYKRPKVAKFVFYHSKLKKTAFFCWQFQIPATLPTPICLCVGKVRATRLKKHHFKSIFWNIIHIGLNVFEAMVLYKTLDLKFNPMDSSHFENNFKRMINCPTTQASMNEPNKWMTYWRCSGDSRMKKWGQSVTNLRIGQIGHGLGPRAFGGLGQLFPMTTQCELKFC